MTGSVRRRDGAIIVIDGAKVMITSSRDSLAIYDNALLLVLERLHDVMVKYFFLSLSLSLCLSHRSSSARASLRFCRRRSILFQARCTFLQACIQGRKRGGRSRVEGQRSPV